MAEYGKLFGRIWSDPEFVTLEARPQQLYALMVSFPTRNPAGVLPLTLKRWAKCTRGATPGNVSAALKVLVANKFIVVDWDTEEALVRTFIRNDEVYRQPNVMKSALKFALKIESETLRWALHDELRRIPEHKNSDHTKDVAYALVEGLTRTPAEPFLEPFLEPLAEPLPLGCGVGSYVSGVRVAPSPTPPTSPSPTPPPTAEPLPAGAARGDPPRFDDFWAAYPLRRDKGNAVKAFANALKRADADTIIAGARRYANDPGRDDRYTKYAQGWLNADCWLDEPLPSRASPAADANGHDAKVNEFLAYANLPSQPELDQ
jgi:hypothetical protein